MKRFSVLMAAIAICALSLAAQPNFKTNEEYDGFIAIQAAATIPDRIEAGTAFMAAFPDSEAKGLAAYMLMLSYQGNNDFDNMLIYGDEVLANTEDAGIVVGTLVSLSGAIPNRTREFDLDKEEKLSKAEDYAKRAMTMIPTLVKPDPAMPDEDWLMTKKEFMSQCHESLGLVSAKRSDHAAAEASLRQSMDLATAPTPSVMYNLGLALMAQDKKSEAATVADTCSTAGGYVLGDGTDLCVKLKAEATK